MSVQCQLTVEAEKCVPFPSLLSTEKSSVCELRRPEKPDF